MGTAIGAHSRRYHGLLVAAAVPPVRRVLALHSLVEQLVVDGTAIDLATHRFGDDDLLHPDGWRRLERFELDADRHARWAWRSGPVRVTKTVMLGPGRNAVEVAYEVRSGDVPVTLRLRPLTPLRDFHHLVTTEDDPPAATSDPDGGVVLRRGDLELALEAGPGATWRDEPQWWRDLHYAIDRDRGQDWRETLFSPGAWEASVPAAATVTVTVRAALVGPPADPPPPPPPPATRPKDAIDEGRDTTPLERLRRACGQFVVQRRDQGRWTTSIIAGYPWFADWGRDTMISVPGLLICEGRLDEAESVLRTFARRLQDGIIPNRFDDDAGPPAYNTVDASLWFVHAAHDLAEARAGRLPDDLLDACRGVIAGYRSAGGLARMDRDGLVIAGTEHTALTWMDARREDIVFTPRGGKPVEINALWHHALHCVAALVDDETEQAELRELAGRAAIAFQMGFWWPERRCCHDVLVRRHDEWVGDGRLRPNQIIAAALRFTPLTDAQRRDIIGTVRDRLLTPYGLRTLDPDDPEYCPRFEGDMFERDAAYHQGTVWPWLIGPYGEAVLRAGRFGDAAKRHVRRVIDPLVAELDGGCLDQVAEVYDADPPHRPGGCAAQAWSVAELRRLVHLAGLPGLGP